MPRDGSETYRDDLLIEIIARRLGVDRLARALPGRDVYPPYLLVCVGLFVEYGVIDVYNYLVAGKSSWITGPSSLAIPAMAILGVVGLRYIHDTYADAIVRIGVGEDAVVDPTDRSLFEGLVSVRVRVAAFLATLVVYYLFLVVGPGVSTLVSISGWWLVAYANLVSFPLIVIPVLVELTTSYVAVHVAVPRRLEHADMDLFFYDPRNLGGFEPIGELLKRSYYVYTGLLLLWFFQTHAPVILSRYVSSPYPAPGPIYQAAITAAWLLGVATIGYSMYRTHGIMSRKREARLASLEAELKATVSDPYDVERATVEDRERYEAIRKRLAMVRDTKTYPTTFTMWSQIFLTVLLPQALNMVVQLPG